MAYSAEVRLTWPDPRPFVKWAGGKGALVSQIALRIPRDVPFRRYVEPFVGAGALFFWIRRSFPGLSCRLSDSNEELIRAYRAVRDDPERILAKLETHETLHGRDHFYAVRASRPKSDAERAARFIYLNRTCYNGLYRVNRKGEFNVPIGRYARPLIADRENLLAVSTALQGVELRVSDFESAVEDCGAEDLVYLDPPYHPLSRTSHFRSYTAGGFDASQQRRLAEVFQSLCRRGAAVIESNSSADLVRELYAALDPEPVIEELQAPRAINSKATRRGRIAELLIHYAPERTQAG